MFKLNENQQGGTLKNCCYSVKISEDDFWQIVNEGNKIDAIRSVKEYLETANVKDTGFSRDSILALLNDRQTIESIARELQNVGISEKNNPNIIFDLVSRVI